MIRRLRRLYWLILFLPTMAIAHPGGLDSNGGHVNRSTGEYHCHRTDCVSVVIPGQPAGFIDVVSFNIQFLGNFKNRDNEALTAMVSPYDLVVIQELVAPPYAGEFPNGDAYRPDPEAQQFFDSMNERGFDYVLSEEDTGTGDNIHNNGAATEWWVVFYKPEVVEPANALPHGFLASDRSNHSDFERVPYAFAFRTLEGGNDFVLISVHLQPGDSSSDTDRREHELDSITDWVNRHDSTEKDFFVLGDMNFEDCAEITNIIPANLNALNQGVECVTTNTNTRDPRPYDNVLYPTAANDELFEGGQFRVLDLIGAMRTSWYEDFTEPYPGDDPYNHNAFRARYSDHHPVTFKLRIADDDD